MSQNIPYYHLKGNPEALGHQHGKFLADRIEASYAFYTTLLFTKPEYNFKDWGKLYLDVIAAYHEDFALEIEAIASGAGMKPWQIAVLNARTEIFLQANRDLLECTAMYFPKTSVLGQTWDWMRPCEDFIAILDMERPDGHRMLMMTEPGIIGKIGLNSAGIGTCLNILIGQGLVTGVPIHVVLRMMLEEKSLEDIQTRLDKMPLGTFSNILLADDKGRYRSLEFLNNSYREVEYGDGIPIHTNHYLTENRDDPAIFQVEDSLSRMEQATSLCAGVENGDVAEMKAILGNSDVPKTAICKDYFTLWELERGKMELGTICSMVMDLPRRTLHITDGNPKQNGYLTYKI